MSFKPEVQTVSDGDSWTGNGLRFATREEAQSNVNDLMGRWMAVTATRVVESDDPVNYAWITGKGLVAVDEDGHITGGKPRMPARSVTL
jgi:hypothetical protein